ncbi:MAG TPA: hypothetical protein DEF34_03345 [Desulfotomaculum sp.]|nr:hypothetical protein [Desulfotomaculum sp.]
MNVASSGKVTGAGVGAGAGVGLGAGAGEGVGPGPGDGAGGSSKHPRIRKGSNLLLKDIPINQRNIYLPPVLGSVPRFRDFTPHVRPALSLTT